MKLLRPLALALALSAVGSSVAVAATDESVPAPTTKLAYTAKILTPTKATSEVGGGRVITTLKTTAAIYGGSNELLVVSSAKKDDNLYVKVRLTSRPNDAAGWVSADDVYLQKVSYRIVVDISSRKVSLLKSGKTVVSTKAVVGANRTPTPLGVFAITESVPQPRGSKLGSYVVALTAHSNVHKTFDGGDGRVGIHGYEKLGNGLGSKASNGCIRIPERVLKKIVAMAPPGTPVAVVN